jgi:hypothetical protein
MKNEDNTTRADKLRLNPSNMCKITFRYSSFLLSLRCSGGPLWGMTTHIALYEQERLLIFQSTSYVFAPNGSGQEKEKQAIQ